MLTGSQRLDAMAWMARKNGVSYGTLKNTLTPTAENAIYEEYEKKITKERQEEQARIKAGKKQKKAELKPGPIDQSPPPEQDAAKE